MNEDDWLVDLSRGDDWGEPRRLMNPRSRTYTTAWTVEEVMSYYGKWIESEEVAVDMMKEVMRRTPFRFRKSFSAKMNLIRDLLKYEYGHEDIPFVPIYRRHKS